MSKKRPHTEESHTSDNLIRDSSNNPSGYYCDQSGHQTQLSSDHDDVSLLTPQTLRLLKLIQDGSEDHARTAAEQLQEISKQNSSPTVLWDILGRLQGFLISPHWYTRRNAQLAMEGVARNLPVADQASFLQASHTRAEFEHYGDGKGSSSSHSPSWLRLEVVKDHLPLILQQGRKLMSGPESKFQVQLEDQQLEYLSNTKEEGYSSEDTFCSRRLEMQRQILSRRLGLTGVMTTYTSGVETKFQSELVIESMEAMKAENNVGGSCEPRKKQKEDPKHINTTYDTPISIRSLLIREIRQQQQHYSRRGHTSKDLSHRNPQALLAGELVYRMFDPSWFVRHGSLMGILALLRTWNLCQGCDNNQFGTWPHEILARSICILALDRFGDFSGTSTEAYSGSMVAPVREMAGQVFSVVFCMAPKELQQQANAILIDLTKSEEWEVRHGALLALKYQLSLIYSTNTIYEKLQIPFESNAINIAMTSLQDSSDDVQAVSAQILLRRARRQVMGKRTECVAFRSQVGKLAWEVLKTTRPFSSSLEDLVALFAQTTLMHFESASKDILRDGTLLDTIVLVFTELCDLLDSEYINVKISIVHAIGLLGTFIPITIASWQSSSDWSAATPVEKKPLSGSVCIPFSFKTCYCDMVKTIYDLLSHYCDVLFENGDEEDVKVLVRECSETWKTLSAAHYEILPVHDALRHNLEEYILADFFSLSRDSTRINRSLTKASGNEKITGRMDVAQWLANFWAPSCEPSCVDHSYELLQFFLHSGLESPLLHHCEASCCLIYALLKAEVLNASLRNILEACIRKMQASLSGGPTCLHYDYSNEKNINLILQCFGSGCRSIDSSVETGVGLKAAKNLCESWHQLIRRPSGCESVSLSVESMRLKSFIAGTIISGGAELLPKKLTLLVRPLMTSLQNEVEPSWRNINCGFTSDFLLVLRQPVPSERVEGLQKTFGKVMDRLCMLVTALSEPVSSSASRVIGLFSRHISSDESLFTYNSLWEILSPLLGSWDEVEISARKASLSLLQAVCQDLYPEAKITKTVIETFCPALIFVGCKDEQSELQVSSIKIVVRLCSCNCHLGLENTLPALIKYLNDGKEHTKRSRACRFLKEIIDGVACPSALSPFVRTLLPIAMSLMTDWVKETAMTAASLFSRLVQVAPLVKDLDSSTDSELNAGSFDLVINHLIHGKKLPECDIPDILTNHLSESGIVLRDYQVEGVSWLRFLHSVKLNGALCDSMGLGKTATALIVIALSHLSGNDSQDSGKKSLIVCPSSVVGHWMNEIKRFLPTTAAFNAVSLTGTMKQRKAIFGEGEKQYNLIVTSYAVLRSDIEKLSELDWTYVVLDEGHLLKNPKTATARASRRLKSCHKIVLSGTPVQNHVKDVWAIFDFLMPYFLGSHEYFSKEFAGPISKGQKLDSKAEDVAAGIEKLKQLHQQVLPFILRREKNQVLKELPPKIVTRIPCIMSPLQQNLYRHFCCGALGKEALTALNDYMSSVSRNDNTASSQLGKNVLRSLLYLRLLCTHPWLVRSRSDPSTRQAVSFCNIEASGKFVALLEILRECGIIREEHTAADNDSSLLYCENSVGEYSGGDEYEQIIRDSENGLDDHLRQYQCPDSSKCLIFAQFVDSLDIVEEVLLRRHLPRSSYLRLDGRVPTSKRAEVVDAFNHDEGIKILLLTSKVGGLGLNLTGADTVIFLEHDWNPHVDLQAMDRAHRLGQKKTVHVYQLVTENSIEEKTMAIHDKKMVMSNTIISTENSSLYSLGTERLLDIFQFRSEVAGGSVSVTGFEDNLDALVERYNDEYQALSIDDFVKSFRPEN
ncbi:SNF2-related protein [Nitzschia inconspicua]|uniref:SNF2-related protein n=1 Tax=Nitzschia inconspicua TaxID=303405 RepID=A0A9K3KM95_9STRA|nr:SNF2-related protein [Nitzschia inconspicua]